MQYIIFKLNDKDKLHDEMLEKNYEKIGNEITSNKYKLNLYYKYDNDLKLSWDSILSEFGATSHPKRTGICGIIMCESNNSDYAITYGSSSFLVQKYCDKEFGFNFAKRIGLKEMKRKSSMTPYSNKNSSITSYKNTKTILFDTGENVTSLSFAPEDEFYGKRIDIGKSIKLKKDISLKDISILLDKIEEDLKNDTINNIPLLTRITNEEEIERYNNIMYENLDKEINSNDNIGKSQFSFSEFTIVGSSFYFEEDHTQIIKIGSDEFEIELHDLNDLYELSKLKNISMRDIIEDGKIIYKDEKNKRLYADNIKKFISYEIEKENVSLYENEWFYYNQDYYDLIMNEIRNIEVRHNESDDCTKEILETNRINKKEYREEILNKLLSKKYNGELLDRNIFLSVYENEYFNSKYKIELADLIIGDEYISVKIGSAQSLSYCVDQSELSAKLISYGKVDPSKYNLPVPQEYGMWFYFETDNIIENGRVQLEKINSIMLLSKISNWSKTIRSLNKMPIIHVNKYKN